MAAKLLLFGNMVHWAPKASHQKYKAKTGGSAPAGPDCGTLNSPGWVTSNQLLQMKNTLLLT